MTPDNLLIALAAAIFVLAPTALWLRTRSKRWIKRMGTGAFILSGICLTFWTPLAILRWDDDRTLARLHEVIGERVGEELYCHITSAYLGQFDLLCSDKEGSVYKCIVEDDSGRTILIPKFSFQREFEIRHVDLLYDASDGT